MEDKRVADYFVVAGLPTEGAPDGDGLIKLDEYSNEAVLKTSHNQVRHRTFSWNVILTTCIIRLYVCEKEYYISVYVIVLKGKSFTVNSCKVTIELNPELLKFKFWLITNETNVNINLEIIYPTLVPITYIISSMQLLEVLNLILCNHYSYCHEYMPINSF